MVGTNCCCDDARGGSLKTVIPPIDLSFPTVYCGEAGRSPLLVLNLAAANTGGVWTKGGKSKGGGSSTFTSKVMKGRGLVAKR